MNVVIGALLCTLLLTAEVRSLNLGVNTFVGEYPAHVAVAILPTNGLCGGAIINPTHVLTACRCVLNANNELLALTQVVIRSAGVLGLTNASPNTLVTAIFPHPQYNPFTHQNDLAVIRVGVAFVFNLDIANPPINAAVRTDRVISDATSCHVLGWNQPTAAIPTQFLQRLPVPIINRDACNVPVVHNGQVREPMVCAGSMLTNQGGICESTRGGGLYCNNHLVGIASFGFGCGTVINQPGVYTQIRMYQPWINDQLVRTQIPHPGPTPHPGVFGSATSVVVSATAMFISFMVVAFYR